MDIVVHFTLNGKPVTATCPSDATLLYLLREVLHLTGTKEGCSVGECGACTVIMNGRTVDSCLVLAGSVENADVVTIEGLADEDGSLSVLQQAFTEAGAVQCGYCTPGMVLSAKALLDQNPDPTEDEIRLAISGNLCRCTGYRQIVEAVQMASEKMRKAEN